MEGNVVNQGGLGRISRGEGMPDALGVFGIIGGDEINEQAWSVVTMIIVSSSYYQAASFYAGVNVQRVIEDFWSQIYA